MSTARTFTLATIGILAATALLAEAPPPAAQIAAALLAAPEDRRDGAEVLGYDAAGAVTVLRKGFLSLYRSSPRCRIACCCAITNDTILSTSDIRVYTHKAACCFYTSYFFALRLVSHTVTCR